MARRILVGALLCLALTPAPAAGAQDSRAKVYRIDVTEQPLTHALEQLNRQTGVLYGYIPETPEEEKKLVGPVRGKYTIDRALTELLRTTDLTFEWTTAKTVTIVRRPPAPKPPQQPAKQTGNRRPAPQGKPPADSMSNIIEEVISSASSIQGRFSLPAPLLVLDQGYIKHTGASTISDLLRYLSQQSYLRPEAYLSNGAQYVELRGLGPDTTLVLINGRRVFASAASFTANAFDVNQLPLSAVKQVEVKLDSVSVRHGADAIGGIVNIILLDDISDPAVQLQYGAADGGSERIGASIAAGYEKEGSVTASIVLDYREVGALKGSQRDLWRNQDYRRFGSVDRRATISSPGNVAAVPPGNLPGLNSPVAAIPDHIAGQTLQLSELRAGELNYESLFRYIPIVAEDRRASAVANARLDIASGIAATADLQVVDRHVAYQTTPPLVPAALVPGTNPYNVFQQPVVVSALLEGVNPTQVDVNSLLVRGAAALHGNVRQWGWELSLVRSEEDAESRLANVLDNARLTQVLADPDRARTIDLFRPGPAASPDVLATLLLPTDVDTFSTGATQLSAVASGELFALPAGDVSAVIGTEWRKESVQFDSLLGSFHREVAAGFAELHLPLIAQAMGVPAVRELTVTAAGRFDSYNDFGEIFNPQFGLLWKPLDELTVRATYGRSFRPPSMYDLYLPATPVEAFVLDPRRDRELASVQLIGGGHRELEATSGESYTAGFELSPAAIEHLQLSATYWHVAMDDRVTALSADVALAREFDVPGRVVRAEPTPADLAAGLPGRVLQIDGTRMSFGRLVTSGVDFGANYWIDTVAGHFTLDTKATWIDEYETLDIPGVPAADRVNVASSLGTIAKWRAIASVDWQRNSLGATTHVRYTPSYADTLNGVRNGRTLSAQTFLDVQLALEVGSFELTLGSLNVLDQQPDFAEVNGIQGYDISQGDIKGRLWYLRLAKTF